MRPDICKLWANQGVLFAQVFVNRRKALNRERADKEWMFLCVSVMVLVCL